LTCFPQNSVFCGLRSTHKRSAWQIKPGSPIFSDGSLCRSPAPSFVELPSWRLQRFPKQFCLPPLSLVLPFPCVRSSATHGICVLFQTSRSVHFLIRRCLVVPLLFDKKAIVQFGTYYLLIQLPTIYFVYSYYRVLISHVMTFLILACCGEHRLNSLGRRS
jgi:hypothetical protein